MNTGDLLILIAALPVNLFALVYGVFFPWWRRLMGVAVELQAISIALILDLAVIRIRTGTTAPETLRIVVFGFVVIALWLKLAVLIVAVRRKVMDYRAPMRIAGEEFLPAPPLEHADHGED